MSTYQLIPNNYRLQVAEKVLDSFSSQSNNAYYVFTCKASAYANGGAVVPILETVKTVQFDAYNSMLFGKYVDPASDVSLMVKYYPYVANTVYAQFDDIDPLLHTKEFFVCVLETSTYYVFKCLFNNGGIPSTVAPSFAQTNAQDEFYSTSDGYQWKYLYTIDSDTFNKFSTPTYIPVIPDIDVTANAHAGAVDVILVTSPGSGYRNYYSGILPAITNYNPAQLWINILGSQISANSLAPSSNTGFYDGCYVYLTGGTGKGQYKTITGSSTNTSGIYCYLDSEFTVAPFIDTTFDISPKVVILNSTDNDSGVTARAIIDPNSNVVQSISILDRGSNVYSAGAYVYSSNAVGVTNAASLRVVCGPIGGHGSNVASELFCSSVGVSLSFIGTESNTIIDSSSYRMAGLMVNPNFANVTFILNTTSSPFLVGETIDQYVTNTGGGNYFILTEDDYNIDSEDSYDLVLEYAIAVTFASATVVGKSGNNLQVSNVSGFFSTGFSVVGQTTSANGVILQILNNGVDKNFDTFNQYYRYVGTLNSGTFIEGEVVHQSNVSVANAIFYANNESGNTIYLTEKLGPFDKTLDIVGSNSAATFTINSYFPPDLIPYSGDILYLEDFDAINRQSTQSETIKLILEY